MIPPTFGGDVTYHFGKHEEAPAETAAAYVPPPVVNSGTVGTLEDYLVFFDFNKSDLDIAGGRPLSTTAAANASARRMVTQLTVWPYRYGRFGRLQHASPVAAVRDRSRPRLEKDGIVVSEIEIVAKGKRRPAGPDRRRGAGTAKSPRADRL